MDQSSFYKGILFELSKTSEVLPKKKKSFIGPALSGAGLGLGAYGAYKHFNPSQPATPPVVDKPRLGNPYISYINNNNLEASKGGYTPELDQDPSLMRGVANTASLPMLGLYTTSLAKHIPKAPASVTSIANRAGSMLGKAAPPMASLYYGTDPEFTDPLTKMVTGKPVEETPITSNITKGVAGLGMGAAQLHPATMIATLAGETGRQMLKWPGEAQSNFHNDISAISDNVGALTEGIKSRNPEVSALAREAADRYLNSEGFKQTTERLQNPGIGDKLLLNNFGINFSKGSGLSWKDFLPSLNIGGSMVGAMMNKPTNYNTEQTMRAIGQLQGLLAQRN